MIIVALLLLHVDNSYGCHVGIVDDWKLWEQLLAYFPLLRHGPHRKRQAQQLFYSCLCISCHGNEFTGKLPNNDKGG
jgi:hypothetical protein